MTQICDVSPGWNARDANHLTAEELAIEAVRSMLADYFRDRWLAIAPRLLLANHSSHLALAVSLATNRMAA